MSGTPIGKTPLRSRQLFWRKRRLLVSRCSSSSDIEPASTNKYSIAGVRGPKYSCGNSLSLVRPVSSYVSLFLSPFLVSRSLGDLPKLGYGRREDVRNLLLPRVHSYWTSVDSLCQPDPLDSILRDILLIDDESRQPLRRTDYGTRIPALESFQFAEKKLSSSA